MPSRSTKAPKSTMLEMVPGDQVAHVHAVEDLLARAAALFFQHGAAAEHHVVAEAVELDDPALEGLAQELVQVGHPADVDQRGGQEAAHAQVEDETTLDHFDDVARDRGAFFGGLLDALPGPLEPRPLPGEDQPAVGVFFGEHESVDDVAHRDFFGRVDGLSDRQLVGRDYPFALVADVDEDFVLVDPHHSPGDDVPFFEGHDRGVVVGNHLPVDFDHEVLAALQCLLRSRRCVGLTCSFRFPFPKNAQSSHALAWLTCG